ncbi:short chain dehydrogenase MYCFIDRAFT_6125-like [Wolffia australiana]
MAEGRVLRKPWQRLEGKTVMVTGASSGLGRELCLDLAAAGCTVLAAARRVDRLNSLCDELRRTPQPGGSPPPRPAAVELDLASDGSAIDRAVHRAWSLFGPIDALINNAGVRGCRR